MTQEQAKALDIFIRKVSSALHNLTPAAYDNVSKERIEAVERARDELSKTLYLTINPPTESEITDMLMKGIMGEET